MGGKTTTFFFVLLILGCFAFPATTNHRSGLSDHEQDLGFLAGSYTVIGKKIESGETYLGKVRLIYRENDGFLEMIRIIGGRTVRGKARIEPVLAGESRVLRLYFTDGGLEYEGTFLWRGDLDNYARLSGYLYFKDSATDDPGLEAMFIDR